MKFERFKTDEGEILVNMDKVYAIRPSGDDYALTGADGKTLTVVSQVELDTFLSRQEDDRTGELMRMVSRLVQAVDRLTIRIPSSIRMHL